MCVCVFVCLCVCVCVCYEVCFVLVYICRIVEHMTLLPVVLTSSGYVMKGFCCDLHLRKRKEKKKS